MVYSVYRSFPLVMWSWSCRRGHVVMVTSEWGEEVEPESSMQYDDSKTADSDSIKRVEAYCTEKGAGEQMKEA